MPEKIYAVAGSFAMKPGSEKGVHIFRYEPENALFTLVGNYRPEINAGQRTYNKEKDVIYITHESKDRDGEKGGGGRILAFKLDHETGEPTWLKEQDTNGPLPSDICLDAGGRYVIVPHHGSGNIVTKTRKREDGGFEAFTDSDDCTLALFKVEEDGDLGPMCDASRQEIERDEHGAIKKIPHLHNCVQSPDGNLFLVCDKGLDMIHSYKLDSENGRLVHVNSTGAGNGSHPRYGVFHPSVPVFYQNCENSAYVNSWTYDSGSGKLTRLERLPLLFDEKEAAAWTEEGAADIVLTPDGKNLYISVRGLNVLSVFSVDENGSLKLIQNIGCQGKNPRGLCLSPDSRYLFSINRDSNCIARFLRNEDGMLAAAGAETECSLPGNMQFIVYE